MTFLFKACALMLVLAVAQAEVFRFDPEGYQRHINRVARAAKPGWSSSSSSSSSSSGGPVYFGGSGSASTFSSSSNGGYPSSSYQPGFQQQSFGYPDFGFGFPGAFVQPPEFPQIFGFGDNGGDLGVRLGAGPGSQGVYVAASQHSNQPGGVYSSSSSGIDSNGNVHFHAEKGRF